MRSLGHSDPPLFLAKELHTTKRQTGDVCAAMLWQGCNNIAVQDGRDILDRETSPAVRSGEKHRTTPSNPGRWTIGRI